MKSWQSEFNSKRQEMKVDGYVVHGGLGMARGASLRVDDGAGIQVYVWEGELWATQEGDARDYFVSPGQWFRLERDGTALLYATRRTHVSLTSSKAQDHARRITLTPAGTTAQRVLYERAPRRRGWLAFLKEGRLNPGAL
jgi:hypothetical protein